MKRGCALLVVFVLTIHPASAETLIPQTGAPFCQNRDDLQEYVTAIMQHDEQWMHALGTCGMLKGGLKVGIIEEYPSDSDIGHVDKVRVFGPSGSAVGFITSIGLEEKK